ncbi:MAG: glycoside hydrolase family 2, partial [Acidobacteria bacterium]|nr:glycoside hydrolase family 2 [Acidobacteriota bacterium]
MLNFGAVDYEAIVWVNGERAGEHRGGNVGFAFDITDLLKDSGNSVVVRVFDPSTDRTIPRGKQFWELKSAAIWYTRTTGIWQPVWIETVAPIYVKRLRITPDVDNSQVKIETILNQPTSAGEKLRFTATLRGKNIQTEISAQMTGGANPFATLHLNDQDLWSPERPTLYDLRVELVGANNQTIDRVDSYFGQRKIAVQGEKIFLNNNPYYQKLVLDQGYWQDSTITPPTDEAIQYDIKMAKSFGLNGARKHQKVEDPRWLYW